MQPADPARAAVVVAQPALGGRVAHDAVRRRPACAEQLGEHGVVRLEQPALVLGMGVALVREQEARADDDRLRAGRERRLDVGALGHAAREPDREARRRARRARGRATPAPASSRARGRRPRRPARSRRRPRRPRPPSPPPPTRTGAPRRRPSPAAASPQNVTTASASRATSQCPRRANGSSRFTATGRALRSRWAASSARSIAGGMRPSCPRPPASAIATVSRARERPPPSPAPTIGCSRPSRSRRLTRRSYGASEAEHQVASR